MSQRLGRLEAVDVRSIWRHEAHDFTQWLARPENMAELADTLGFPTLEVEAVEKSVGQFSLDILARDENGSRVLIENQLAASDHRHVGQIMTYVAGIENAVSVVWINTAFREEHRAVIDWLNNHIDGDHEFFGVEIEAYRIGDSLPAPRFSVVSQPNAFSRAARTSPARSGDEYNDFYTTYWTAFLQYLSERDQGYARTSAPRGPYYEVPIGRSGIWFTLRASRRDGIIAVELYLASGSAKQVFDALHADRDRYEATVGTDVSWLRNDDKKASKVETVRRDVNLNDERSWFDQHCWFVERLSCFQDAFARSARQLDIRFAAEADTPVEEAA